MIARHAISLFLVCLICFTVSSRAFPAASQPGSSPGPLVTVKNGTYQGIHDSVYNQDYFLGIPYAQPPVGQGRLNFPRPLRSSFQGTRSAQQYSPQCVGYGADNNGFNQSEDCLYLNVYRPAGYTNQTLPVGVWIYGGGFKYGGGNRPQYNMSFILRNSVAIDKPIITVTLNYRMSGWGWLWSDEVQKAGVTNLGWRDTRLALAWLQENIAAFGGDPSKVTIWGQSAGAGIAALHTIAFGGRDEHLFRGLIAESGPPELPGILPPPLSTSQYANITRDTGCNKAANSLACLRNLPFATFNKALNNTVYKWGPSFDHDIIRMLPSIQVSQGKFTKTAMLGGTNTDDGTFHGGTDYFAPFGINTDADFANEMVVGLGVINKTVIREIMQAYPNVPQQGLPATFSGPLNTTIGLQWKRISEFFTDFLFLANRRASHAAWANHSVPSYAYRFDTLSSNWPALFGVTHYTEVAFVFDNLMGLGSATSPFANEPDSHKQLAGMMSKAWISFIHDLNPNGHGVPGVPHWPAYNNSSPQDFVLDANVTGLAYVEPDTYRASKIKLIQSLNPTIFHR